MNTRMSNSSAATPGDSRFYLLLLVMVAIGAWLRLNQFTQQVLLDDEWHVIHQLLFKGPKELFLTLGHADFSIPLGLMYWLELKQFGLSELAMRWPMMCAGLLTLVVFPLYVRKYFDRFTTLLFSLLLVISPMLVIYSRTARPYALTLLLSLLALAAFHQFVVSEKSSWKSAIVYALCAVGSAWLHLISLPLIVAPFLVFGLPALIDRNWGRVGRLFYLGLFTLAGLLVVVLPPLLGHPEDLGAKLGVHNPDMQTYYGVLFVWLGTPSQVVVLTGVILAALGAGSLWREFPLTASLLTGLGLTFVLILLTQPAWVNHPLTLARYLLPAAPLFLLAISLGLKRLIDTLAMHWGRKGNFAALALAMSVLLLMAFHSPLFRILAKPNSNSLHSVYQFDFRDDKNLISLYQKDFAVSPFWKQLAKFPRDSLKIAAAPFSFETHHWDAARWEQISQQRVMPGFLNSFCVTKRWGEVPKGRGFRFRNVAYLDDQLDMIDRGFDLVVYQKPFKVKTNEGEKEFGMDTVDCIFSFREQFPAPVYEDDLLVVFPLHDRIKGQFNAER